MDDYGYDEKPRWHRLAAILLLTVAAVAAAFTVGRLTAPSSGPERPAAVAAQPGPGPTRVVNGVPVGYAHTPDGAVAAATNFVMVQTGPLISQPDKYRAAIDTIAAPEAKATLRNDAEKSISAFTPSLISNAQHGRAVIFRSVPLAYHVERYDGRVAQVTIWSESFVGVDSTIPMTESWTTATYPVEWVAGDWKLAGEGVGSQGPVPMITQPSAGDLKLPPQAKEFQSYQYGPVQ